MANTVLGLLTREPEEVYHAQAADHLTSHRLADFRKCPLLYHRKQLGLVADADRPAYRLGRAAHTLILEGRRRFEATYAVGGPVNPKTGQPYGRRTKTWAEWADAQCKEVLGDDEAALCVEMNAGVGASEMASDLLAEGVPEGVVRTEYCGIPCQARIDWVNPHRGIVDLETCDDLTWLESDARRYGYAHQLAFYRALLRVASGETASVYLIAVEKKEPFRCGVWRMGEDVLALAQKENEEAIARLKRCRETDSWPTLYEDLRVFDYL
jgi:hypothetical protein